MLATSGVRRDAARQFGAFGTFVGLLCGVAYGIGGAFYDVFTVGWNTGTWLALNALWGMPVLFAALGMVAGILWAPLWERLPIRWGGRAAE